ncbi:MAG: flagellar hook-length control protein FliK [Clostridia bacterium]|nr:flagellar hook-length control protein FliK [Clostridia bacterium]
MINNNMILDMIYRQDTSLSGIAKPDTNSKNYIPEFRSILDNSMGKAAAKVKTEVQPSDKSQNEGFKTVDVKPQINTWKADARITEVKPTVNEEAKVDTNSSGKDTKTDGIKKGKKIPSAEEDAMIESIAYSLGMNLQELKDLLKHLNIKPEDMTNPAKAAEAINKISSFMGLDGSEKGALAWALGTIGNEIGKKLKALDASGPQVPLNNQLQEQAGTIAEITVISNTDAQFQKLISQFRSRLEEISEKLQKNPEGAQQELILMVEELIGKNCKDSVVPAIGTGIGQIAELDTLTEDVRHDMLPEQKSSIENKGGTGAEETESDNDSETGEGLNAKPETIIIDQSPKTDKSEFNNMVTAQAHKVITSHETAQAQPEFRIYGKEIISQVVEKAKIVLNGDKSEMVMDLKPDSLGKLSLKVVTERGMVVAQFVADNQQVKQTLEANMQILKDTLEKQGLAVQEFSVSVRQDTPKHREESGMAEGNRRQNPSRITPFGSARSVMTGAFGSMQRLESMYCLSGSSINLTA